MFGFPASWMVYSLFYIDPKQQQIFSVVRPNFAVANHTKIIQKQQSELWKLSSLGEV